MAKYERFQILSAGRQDLFLPEAPLWVSRYQLSRDLESGKRLLQVRMVNLSEKTVRQVFLRILCLDARREPLEALEMVPMGKLRVLPGRLFGDDQPLELGGKGAVFAEIYPQRVCFTDGSTWDEPRRNEYLAFAPPVPVREGDPHYEELASRARSGGVRNDCYFRSQQGLWLCTCGLPNATRALRCAHCGADRLWLEKHMDPNLLEAPAPTPAPAPAAAAPVIPAPAPVIRETYLPSPPAQPTIILQQAEPEPEDAPAKAGGHGGRVAAIVAAVLLFLGLGAFCAYRYLMPLLRYQEALREQAAGNYDRAVELFQDLGEYRDSLTQIRLSLGQKGLALMGEGKYQEALELFQTLEGYESHAADCVYAMGVLAYNDKDLERALDYVAQLREKYPDYDKTDELEQYCRYSLAVGLVQQAAEAEDPARQAELYEAAAQAYAQVGDYKDSLEMVTECRYRGALALEAQGDAEASIEAFNALSGYKDCDERRDALMFEYASQHLENPDQISMDYLEELAARAYPGAAELLARIRGEGFSFHLSLGPQDNTATLVEVPDLSQVYIHYRVERRDAEGAVLVLVLYQLPDGRKGRGLLNLDRSASGSRSWDTFLPTDCTQSGPVTLTFYDSMWGETGEPLESISFRYVYTATQADSQSAGG